MHNIVVRQHHLFATLLHWHDHRPCILRLPYLISTYPFWILLVCHIWQWIVIQCLVQPFSNYSIRNWCIKNLIYLLKELFEEIKKSISKFIRWNFTIFKNQWNQVMGKLSPFGILSKYMIGIFIKLIEMKKLN